MEGLRFAADELGWDVAYMNHQPVKTIGRTSPLSSLAHLWGAARSLVSEFETALPGGGSREDANRCVTQAEGLGALAFVVPREVQGRYHVEMSELGGALIRKRGGEGRPVYSATQRLLGRRHDQESQRLAGRLQQLLERWARSDLFGSNQVSELVTHTESHCEAVDRNVASVVAPLLEDGTLTPQDVFNLAVAAWLHDWGHSGRRSPRSASGDDS
ncbi:MAG: hypothetical protein HZY73_12290 [Micropruina sp.]|nr:MAG: hypothetical protein HZY73_12290 [Micropruina sp.]